MDINKSKYKGMNNMENQYLCDWFRDDYEQYLRQAILFNTKVNVLYPDIDYPRDVDKELMATKISSLERYAGFSNVNIIPLKGSSNRFVDFENSPTLFDTVCRELHLTEVEQKCFLEYRDQEFDYLAFNRWAPWRDFCPYMCQLFNIAIAYTDMTKIFCEAYSTYHGNVLSNSSFLHNLLSSNVIHTESIKEFHEMNCSEIFNSRRRIFSGKYCDYCRTESKYSPDSINPINVKERAIEILIPDYSELEIDDLYEIQTKANSEIEQLATYIDEISIVAYNKDELDRLLKRKIAPAVSELKSKVAGIRLTSLQKALSIRDVAAIPILIELLPDLPGYVPIALSAAFIAADAGIEMRKEYLQLKQDPMYFTIKINKLATKKRKR